MDTPHQLFQLVVADTGDHITAIRAIRERFGLDLRQAKEVMLQAEGVAPSLPNHRERLAEALERALETGRNQVQPGAAADPGRSL